MTRMNTNEDNAVYIAVSRKVVGTQKCTRQFRKVTWDMIKSITLKLSK